MYYIDVSFTRVLYQDNSCDGKTHAEEYELKKKNVPPKIQLFICCNLLWNDTIPSVAGEDRRNVLQNSFDVNKTVM
jgi:hypothetical protein